MSTGKIPPNARSAEEALLGCLLIGSKYIEEAAASIRPEMFYHQELKTIMKAILAVHERGVPIDIITVTSELKRAGEGPGYALMVTELSSQITSDINAAHYAQIVIQKFVNREAIRRSMEIQEAAYNDDTDEVIAQSTSMADDLLNNIPVSNVASITEIFASNTQGINDRAAGQRGNYIDFGIRAIDRILGGAEEGALVVVGGRPGSGKTSFSMQLAYNVSLIHPILYFTLEMTREELGLRYLVMLTDIDSNRLKRGEGITFQEWRLIEAAGRKLEQRNIIIDDSSRLSIYNIRSKVYAMVRSRGVKMVFIDYLQLMDGAKGKEGSEYYGSISRTCKQLAKELKIVIVLLSQLNRDIERRSEKIPKLSDLRACLSTETSLIYTPNNVQNNATSRINLLSLHEHKLCEMTSTDIPKLHNDVFRVKTSSGRFVDATIDHPILTTDGYKKVKDLTVNDVLIVAKNFETEGVYYPESRFIGLMLGNGSMTGKSVPSLIVNDPDVSDYFVNYIYEKFGFYPKRHKHRSPGVFNWDMTKHNVRTKEGNPVKKWLIDKGLWGNYAYTKAIPDWFMETADTKSICELIAGLIETDGSVYECKSTSLNVSYSTISIKLAQQILYLLAKIGIIARVDGGYRSSKANCDLYKIVITDCYYLKLFRDKIPLIGYKAVKLNQFELGKRASYLSNKVSHETSVAIAKLIKHGRLQTHGSRGATKATLLKLSQNNDLGKYAWLLSDNIHFDQVRSITSMGMVRVFDRSVPGTNNFVVNGIVVHNSGEIEQDANVVMFPVSCKWAEIDDPSKGLEPGKAIISIPKNRNGSTGTAIINVSDNFMQWWDESDIFLGPQTPVAPTYLKD